MESCQRAGRHQLWQVKPHFHYGETSVIGDPLEAQGGVVGERRRGTKHSRRTQAEDKKGLMKG